jgi:hypothetical protein
VFDFFTEGAQVVDLYAKLFYFAAQLIILPVQVEGDR